MDFSCHNMGQRITGYYTKWLVVQKFWILALALLQNRGVPLFLNFISVKLAMQDSKEKAPISPRLLSSFWLIISGKCYMVIAPALFLETYWLIYSLGLSIPEPAGVTRWTGFTDWVIFAKWTAQFLGA